MTYTKGEEMTESTTTELGDGWKLDGNWLHKDAEDGNWLLDVDDQVAAIFRRLATAIAAANERLMRQDAHDLGDPAYFRSVDAATSAVTAIVQKVLDGKDDGSGMNGFAPLEQVRRDILAKNRRLDQLETALRVAYEQMGSLNAPKDFEVWSGPMCRWCLSTLAMDRIVHNPDCQFVAIGLVLTEKRERHD